MAPSGWLRGLRLRPRSLFTVLVLAYLASGFYVVQSDESGLPLLLGRVVDRDVAPGIHWNPPWPFGSVVVEKTATNFTMPIGFRLITRAEAAPVSDLWLTGDTNIVSGRVTLQYRIRSLADFRFRHETPRNLLRRAGERVLTRFLVGQDVDSVLTSGRTALTRTLQRDVQEILDAEGAGIELQSVAVQELAPPQQGGVQSAFQQVQDSRANLERALLEANAYAAQVVVEAEADAERLKGEAGAARHRRVALARAEGERFQALARAHARAPEVTERRLYLESIERLLPRIETYVVQPAPDGKVNLRVVK